MSKSFLTHISPVLTVIGCSLFLTNFKFLCLIVHYGNHIKSFKIKSEESDSNHVSAKARFTADLIETEKGRKSWAKYCFIPSVACCRLFRHCFLGIFLFWQIWNSRHSKEGWLLWYQTVPSFCSPSPQTFTQLEKCTLLQAEEKQKDVQSLG